MFWKNPEPKLIDLIKRKLGVHFVVLYQTVKDSGKFLVPKYNFYVNKRMFTSAEFDFDSHSFKSSVKYALDTQINYATDFMTELHKVIGLEESS